MVFFFEFSVQGEIGYGVVSPDSLPCLYHNPKPLRLLMEGRERSNPLNASSYVRVLV